MPPINLYSKWNQRPSDSKKHIEPLRKYFFICEGKNTESFYFKKIINKKKEIGFHPSIELVLMQKTGKDENLSNPKQLVDFAIEEKEKLIEEERFEVNTDVLIIIFDLDVFKNRMDDLQQILEIQTDYIWLGLTNPDFELFLLLHIEDSINDVIIPNQNLILENNKIGNHRPCYKFLLEQTNMNSKKNPDIGNLAYNIDTAIKQEKLINQDLNNCLNLITSNIASLIEKIRDEKLPF